MVVEYAQEKPEGAETLMVVCNIWGVLLKILLGLKITAILGQ